MILNDNATAQPEPENTRIGNDLVRLRLDIAYDGTDFHGWARQSDVRSVQGDIEQAFQTVVRQPVQLVVAGRTDAGVHASGQVAHVDVPRDILSTRSIHNDPSTLVPRFARLLRSDVRIRACSFAPDGFDARFSALRRHYVYRVTTNRAGALPTRARDTAVWGRPVDLDAMNNAAEVLVGLHDFAAFCRARPYATTIRDLQHFSWHEVSTAVEPDVYEAYVTADAFCWNMVRSIVGASLAVGEGKRPNEFIEDMLAHDSRHPMVPVAPAHGLTLTGVDYPADDELAARAEQTRGIRSLD